MNKLLKGILLAAAIIILIIAGTLLLTREKQPQYSYIPGKFTAQDLGFFDKKTGSMISLGMKQHEVEQVLGTGEEKKESIEYAGKLEVYYVDDKAAGIRLWTDEPQSRYVTTRNIGKGYSFDEVKSVYGDPSTQAEDHVGYIFEDHGEETYFLHPDIKTMTDESKQRAYFMEFKSIDSKSDIVIMKLDAF
ncbi:hypothetical protein [Paenibacillus azoreducens]|uniref:Uncharacterized protein n=1 Tax=Paenibacillus azoreducens TaxID=116718 RepID=A0A919YL69_9BACL|nr:hypothetical protein [Paenibacillus azoreducens]GIO51410.1 hypothetical protein J34TS1_61750 [Paenibacillus azoreducens]